MLSLANTKDFSNCLHLQNNVKATLMLATLATSNWQPLDGADDWNNSGVMM